MMCASPTRSPSASSTSIRASMHVRIARPRSGAAVSAGPRRGFIPAVSGLGLDVSEDATTGVLGLGRRTVERVDRLTTIVGTRDDRDGASVTSACVARR
jgi:hypothetical protein